jgi:thioredoxin-related protein
MRKIVFLLIALFSLHFSFAQNWSHNLQESLQNAQKENKYILVNFSGSDWCGPCIRLHKEIFTLPVFNQIANQKLVLVNADFPRYKKNQLSAAQQKINDEIAEKYNSKGLFPYTVLLNSKGEQIKSWEGFPSSIDAFIDDLQSSVQGK